MLRLVTSSGAVEEFHSFKIRQNRQARHEILSSFSVLLSVFTIVFAFAANSGVAIASQTDEHLWNKADQYEKLKPAPKANASGNLEGVGFELGGADLTGAQELKVPGVVPATCIVEGDCVKNDPSDPTQAKCKARVSESTFSVRMRATSNERELALELARSRAQAKCADLELVYCEDKVACSP